MVVENLLLVGPRSLNEVVAVVEEELAARSAPVGDGWQITLNDPATLVGIYLADYEDEPDLKLSHYTYVVDATGNDSAAIALQLYVALAHRWETTWMANSVIKRTTSSAAA